MADALCRCDEALLAVCEAMTAAVAAASSAPPLHISSSEAEAVDSMQMEREAFAQRERARLAPYSSAVLERLNALDYLLYHLCDTPVEVLDRDIRDLEEQNRAVGEEMLEVYDEAAALAGTLETWVHSQPCLSAKSDPDNPT